MQDEASIDIIFVGDSVGTNILGYKSEIEVTMADMLHHLKAVRRGVTDAYLLIDMPYASDRNENQAVSQRQHLFLDNGADGVKLEGGTRESPYCCRTHRAGHRCLCTYWTQSTNPRDQSSDTWKNGEQSEGTHSNRQSALADAGAKLIVLEKITEEISQTHHGHA